MNDSVNDAAAGGKQLPGWTAGPWECDSAVFDFDGARFGECAYVLSKAGEQFPASTANARLIAAAPDLYEALDDVLAEALELGLPEQCNTTRAARAALAKALGQ